ncbi:hypothetical protein P9112_012124 [Eukaryota sp. TZLM1-RC]
MRILVVDDDPVTRSTVASMCRQTKAEVLTAENGQQGLDILESSHSSVDLIITDYMMPILDGYEMLKQIKGDQRMKDIPVVLMSTFDDPQMVIRCIEQGATDYLLKPLIFATVRRRIEAIQKAAAVVPADRLKEAEAKARTYKRKYDQSMKEVDNLKKKLDLVAESLKALMSDIIYMPSFSQQSKQAQQRVSELLQITSPGLSESRDFDLFHLLFELEGLDIQQPESVDIYRRRRSSGATRPPTPPLELFLSWSDFDISDMKTSQLCGLWIAMLENLGLKYEFKLEETKLRSFTLDVSRHYKANPYHNFHHAVDVSQGVFVFLKHALPEQFVTPLMALALMTAGLCHDIEHPGLNNAFLIQSKSPLAFLYNDLSVLENHHASRASVLLLKEENNFVAHLSSQDWSSFRQVLVQCILATDMANHVSFCQRIKGLSASCSGEPLSGAEQREHLRDCIASSLDNRLLVCQSILKCCDIGNPTRKFHIAKFWADSLLAEFKGQSETERVHGLQSLIFPQTSESAVNLASLQISFIEHIVSPLLNSIWFLFPQLANEQLTNVENNVVKWKEIQGEG